MGCVPRSAYHFPRSINARTSLSTRSATPSANTTLPISLFLLGRPNCDHSMPRAMYTTVRPSFPRRARSRASARRVEKRARSRASVVSVTVSQGTPELRSRSFPSRSRLTYATFVNNNNENNRVGEPVSTPLDTGTNVFQAQEPS